MVYDDALYKLTFTLLYFGDYCVMLLYPTNVSYAYSRFRVCICFVYIELYYVWLVYRRTRLSVKEA